MKCVSDCPQIWSIFLVIMIIPSMAEDTPAKKIRGRKGYALTGGTSGNESSLTEVSSPFSNHKEGFITEVTYNSGEDIVARLNKKKDLVKFTPAFKNLSNASKEQVGEKEQKTRRKKVKIQKTEELQNNQENLKELKVRMPVRKRYKIPSQANSETSNKENNENSDEQRENYPKNFNIQNLKSIKPFLHTKQVTSNESSSLPVELNRLMVSNYHDFEQIRKGRSETDQSIVGLEFNDEEKGSEQVKKIHFPRPVKDLVILKPEQPKKLVKFEEIVSKQKQLKPELKPSTTTTEIPVQIKKLNFTRKVEPKVVIATTEQPVKIKKFELNRLNQKIQNNKNIRDFTFESERDKSTLNKETSNIKKYTNPEIKQVPVRTITTSEITIPKFEKEKFIKSENQYNVPANDYYEQGSDTQKEVTKKLPSLRQSTLQNNFKLIKTPSKNVYPEIRNNPDTLRHEINYDDGANEDFDYSSGFPESKIKFGSKSKNSNVVNSDKTSKFNPVRNPVSEVKLKNSQESKDKKTIGRFKKKPEVKKNVNTENYPEIKPRPDFKNHLDDIKTEIDLISNPRPELKEQLEDAVIENYPERKQKPELKNNVNEIITENYPSMKPILRPRYKEAEVNPSNQIVTNENKKRKKLKKKKKSKDAATELLNRLTNTFHKGHEDEEQYKGEDLTYLSPSEGSGLGYNKKPEHIDPSISHYLFKQNPPRLNDLPPDHFINDDDTHSPYLETPTNNYEQNRDINQQSSIEDFEKFLRDLSSNLKVKKYENPETFNTLPLPTSSTNQVDYFTPSHSDSDWKPIVYGYVPPKPLFDSHHINNHQPDNHNNNYNNYNNDQKSIFNYNKDHTPIINYSNDHSIDYKLKTNNNFDYDYNGNNYNSQNNDVTLFFDQKGTSVFSSGINDNGQSYYGYRIRSPSSPNEENIFKPSYNSPNNYQHSFNHHANKKLNFNEQKPSSFDFNSFVPNHKPSYDSINYNINNKPKTTKSPFFNHKNNFEGTPLFNKPVDGNYIATSHQSLIRLSANDHPLKSYHDFVVHHRY